MPPPAAVTVPTCFTCDAIAVGLEPGDSVTCPSCEGVLTRAGERPAPPPRPVRRGLLALLYDCKCIARWDAATSPRAASPESLAAAGTRTGRANGNRPAWMDDARAALTRGSDLRRRLDALHRDPSTARAAAVIEFLVPRARVLLDGAEDLDAKGQRSIVGAVGEAFGWRQAAAARALAETELRARRLPRCADGRRATRAELLVEIRTEREGLLEARTVAARDLAAARATRIVRTSGETDADFDAREREHLARVGHLRAVASSTNAQTLVHLEALTAQARRIEHTPDTIRARRVAIGAEHAAAVGTCAATADRARDAALRDLDRLEAGRSLDEVEFAEALRRLPPVPTRDGVRALGGELLAEVDAAWFGAAGSP